MRPSFRMNIALEVISKIGKIGQTERMSVTYGTNR